MQRDDIDPAILLLGVSVAAAAGFAALARGIRRGRTKGIDGQVRKRVVGRRRKSGTHASIVLGPVGKWWGYGPAAIPAASYVWQQRGRAGTAGAAAILASPVVAVAMEQAFDHGLWQRKPPPGRRSPATPSFPSGHSLGPMAAGLTTAYVLVREELADARVAVPVALLVPLVSGVGRLYLDRHWATDLAGGWLAGLSAAAGCAAAYEMGRRY